MLPSKLRQNLNYVDMRRLVSLRFLAALNIYFGGNKALSSDVMSESFHNLSMQVLSISEDSIMLRFDAIQKLNKNIDDLINTIIQMHKISILQPLLMISQPLIIKSKVYL